MMAKDKQWLVEEITKQLNIYGGKGERMEGFNKGLEFVLGMVEELEEPEKPMIPQFIADRIEEYKEIQFGISLIFMINRQIDDDVRFSKWLSSDKDNCELVCRSFLDGYSVEKQERWVVEIGNGYFTGYDELKVTYVPSFNDGLPAIDYAYKYEDEEEAQIDADKIGGKVKKLSDIAEEENND